MVLRVATLQKMTTVRVAYLLQALTNAPSVQLFLLPKSRILLISRLTQDHTNAPRLGATQALH
ncbi:hypothetical protein FOXYSP1_15173 [Fusarium oxysporum f. sp. phaseoli]